MYPAQGTAPKILLRWSGVARLSYAAEVATAIQRAIVIQPWRSVLTWRYGVRLRRLGIRLANRPFIRRRGSTVQVSRRMVIEEAPWVVRSLLGV